MQQKGSPQPRRFERKKRCCSARLVGEEQCLVENAPAGGPVTGTPVAREHMLDRAGGIARSGISDIDNSFFDIENSSEIAWGRVSEAAERLQKSAVIHISMNDLAMRVSGNAQGQETGISRPECCLPSCEWRYAAIGESGL